MINQEVKGTLAKLLATENLKVEHRKVSTAAFDVEKRILILPIWKTASSTVYDLLVGHEVGHALYTPNEDIKGVSKAFVNVLEDARIEKMMKQLYPGLRKSFFEGYKELWNRDFFGVKEEDPFTLSLIDRINLYFKGNPDIPFSDEEMVWVDRTAKTKTFDEVVSLAKELWEYANQKQEQREEMMMPPSPDGNKTSDRDEEVQLSGDNQEGNEGEEDSEDSSDEGEDTELSVSDQGKFDYGSDETESVTDAAFQESLESMVDDNAKEWVYLSLPKINLDDYLTPWQEIQEDLYFFFYGRSFDGKDSQDYYFQNIDYALNHYNNFKKDTQKTVNYLCKQFEMKKSAEDYKRAATSKTGVLNTNKLHQYKINEDLFKKVVVLPEGKNHGLVMFVDWSGSMQHQLIDTLKQTYNLIWFCKKSGIPFRVYGFQSGFSSHNEREGIIQNENELSICSDFRLLEFFSSRQNAKSLEKSMQMIYLQAFAMGGYRIKYMQKYTLGGTPLGEAMMCARSIVNKIKKVEKVSKINVICLTDGESNPVTFATEHKDHYTNEVYMRANYLCHNRNKVFILRDPVTGYSRKIDHTPQHTTKEMVSFMREITDYNWIGIRICNKVEAIRVIQEYAYEERSNADTQWRKEKFASVKNKIGFTEAFFIPNQNMSASSQDIEVKTKKEVATRAELTRAFKKHMGSKMANKTILNAFIEQIA